MERNDGHEHPGICACARSLPGLPAVFHRRNDRRFSQELTGCRGGDGVTEDWTGRYAECAAETSGSAARAPLTLTGFSACVDAVYTVDARTLDTLTHLARRDHAGPETTFARAILERIAEGRGGELFREWDEGPAWAENLLGSPRRLQVGGTGPQAAWALAMLEAPSVMALRDRSPDQLSVLHPAIGMCGPDGIAAVSDTPAGTDATKPR